MKRNTFEDVWKFINKKQANDCWEWLGHKNNTGYGSIGIQGSQYSAHRIVYALTNPNTIDFKAPKNKKVKEFILHICDNRSCCNPNHMKLGNYDDNNKDAKAKGRSKAPQGSNHKKAKLTQEQADQVRILSGCGWSYTELGKMFGLHPNNISRISKYKGYLENRL